MKNRTPFPVVFWVANFIEVLERFAYYGIYLGFGIYMEYLGYTKGQLGIVQSLFLFFSYVTPIFSGSFADKYGFKKILIISYFAYLPTILLLIFTKSFTGIALTMLAIGFAAGIFKPLISGTVRVTSDATNKTLAFGIFYAMVNIGASFGPVVAGKLRAISWNHAFIAAAISIGLMLLITIFFYKEPKREISGVTLKQKFREIGIALSDIKFLIFLILLGLMFWLPLWAFFGIIAVYVDRNLDTVRLFMVIDSIFPTWFSNLLSTEVESGERRLLGETIAHTGYIIMIFQVFISWIFEKFKAIASFNIGLLIAALGMFTIGYAYLSIPEVVFLGIFLFAVGEMIASPRIQEYIMWLAPKEKAGLYMGTNFLATGLGGALSGVTYTVLYGYFRDNGNPEYVWFCLAGNFILGIISIYIFTKTAGEFKELKY
ncbi:MAG: Multidrug resistance protein MdtH [Ignavibacteriaceae bacterium]|nr:Multidrug resistance protein MdtH [Ignavibacteriaceae bacterium]